MVGALSGLLASGCRTLFTVQRKSRDPPTKYGVKLDKSLHGPLYWVLQVLRRGKAHQETSLPSYSNSTAICKIKPSARWRASYLKGTEMNEPRSWVASPGFLAYTHLSPEGLVYQSTILKPARRFLISASL